MMMIVMRRMVRCRCLSLWLWLSEYYPKACSTILHTQKAPAKWLGSLYYPVEMGKLANLLKIHIQICVCLLRLVCVFFVSFKVSIFSDALPTFAALPSPMCTQTSLPCIAAPISPTVSSQSNFFRYDRSSFCKDTLEQA